MDFQTDHEAPLRSFIQQRARDFQGHIEQIAQTRDNNNVDALEREIDQRSDQFIGDVRNRLDSMRNDIKSRRPNNPNDPNFATRLNEYQQFVSSVSVGVQQVTTWVHQILDKIVQLIKQVVQWIFDNAKTIINILKMIRDGFNEFIGFLSH